MEDYETQGLLHESFSRQAKLMPERIAVVTADGETMSFEELDSLTDMIALRLRVIGVEPDRMVAIYMERGLNYVLAYISILKAGGAYLPMDVSYPLPLLEEIIADATPVAIFVDENLLPNAPEAPHTIVVQKGWLDKISTDNENDNIDGSQHDIPPELSLDSLAYTVYSSGTTGKPKGIQCPHRGAVFSYFWRHQEFPYADDDREACNVFFVWEMLRPLQRGIPLYIIPDNVIYDPRLLCDFLSKNVITRVLFTPSLLEAILSTDGLDVAELLKSLRIILFCGEVVLISFLERCMKTLPWVHFVNLYSVSEAHDIACGDLTEWYQREQGNIEGKKFCPVGKLLPSVKVVVLNEKLEAQPLGVCGEIYVSGPTLARGYLNRPELSASRFVDTPEWLAQKAGPRMYRTGDWGYMLSDASFEICGRCDTMVKIRGYSIEVQAVENVLLELPMVNACALTVLDEENEDRMLVAYIVPEGTTTKKEVRAALKRRLPFYMIPSHFVFLTSIPIVAASGKLDRAALPAVERSGDTEDEGMPTTDTEQKLAPLWAEVLHLKSVDIQESFFDLGGHSLLASKLLVKVAESFNVTLSVTDLFVHSSIFTMARLLDQKLGSENGRDSTSPEPSLDLLKEVETHEQAVLCMDIQLRAFWRSMQYHPERWSRGRVFMTGSTGFLGSFILRDLLLKTETHIFCLVRELPDQDGMARVREALEKFGIIAAEDEKEMASDDQNNVEEKLNKRVTAIKGDVGLINMGLSDEDYHYMCTGIDFIIHAAAYVNLVYPYDALHGPNVLGTQNVVVFACTSKIKPLHYISTNGVFPNGTKDCREDADMTQYASSLRSGYSQSKWVAEQLVLKAMERGLPAVIYRLGNLSGETKQAYWNPQDFNLLMLQTCLECDAAPRLDWSFEMTPVDFVSDLIVTLTRLPGLALSKVFHVVNTKPMQSQVLFEWINAHEHPLKILPYDEWFERVKQSEGRHADCLLKLLDASGELFSDENTYSRDNLESILKGLQISYPQLCNGLLRTYFTYLSKRGVMPKPSKHAVVYQPLAGRVAIVTGASSGIGAAIARRLSVAGAHVALAARRDDRLRTLQAEIENAGGTAIVVKCDVTDRNQVAEMVSHTLAALGPIDILVNNAGIMYYTLMKNLHEEDWHRQVDLNCKGLLNCVGGVLDSMLKRGKGHIVNMSSDAGRRGFAGLSVYSGTKFFVEGLSQGMRCELAGSGIKVTCIQPGDVRTELFTHSHDNEAREKYDGSGNCKILEPEDIAQAVLYATSQPDHCAVNEVLVEPREAPI